MAPTPPTSRSTAATSKRYTAIPLRGSAFHRPTAAVARPTPALPQETKNRGGIDRSGFNTKDEPLLFVGGRGGGLAAVVLVQPFPPKSLNFLTAARLRLGGD